MPRDTCGLQGDYRNGCSLEYHLQGLVSPPLGFDAWPASELDRYVNDVASGLNGNKAGGRKKRFSADMLTVHQTT